MQGWDTKGPSRSSVGKSREGTLEELLPPAALRDGLRLLGRYKLEMIFRLTGYVGAMRKIRAAKEQEAAAASGSSASSPAAVAEPAGAPAMESHPPVEAAAVAASPTPSSPAADPADVAAMESHPTTGPVGSHDTPAAAARAYNEAHPAWVEEFNRLTGHRLIGLDGGVDYEFTQAWQAQEGLVADGKVGPHTLAAARANGQRASGSAPPATTEPGATPRPVRTASEAPSPSRPHSTPHPAPASASHAQPGSLADLFLSLGPTLRALPLLANVAVDDLLAKAARELFTPTGTLQPAAASTPAGKRIVAQEASGQKEPPQLLELFLALMAPLLQPLASNKAAAKSPSLGPDLAPSGSAAAGSGSRLAQVQETHHEVVKEQLHPEEFLAQVPNTDRKKHAFQALSAAHRRVAQATTEVQHAKSDAARAAAQKKLTAAEAALHEAKANLVPLVAKALVANHPEVVALEAKIRQAKQAHHPALVAQLQAELPALKERLYPAMVAEAQAMQHAEGGAPGDVFDPTETKITHYDFAFSDGEHVKLRDHIVSYATTVALGYDNDERSHADVKGTMAAAGLSPSKQKILGAISGFEGSFDTINTYDRAILTWGFVQWTGGNQSDLTQALTIIKQTYPDGFARAFQNYGIDVVANQLVVEMPDGSGRLTGDAAARAIMQNPRLGAAMVHAGRDKDVQKGEIRAAEHIEIDAALALSVSIDDQQFKAATLVSSEYGVGLLANTCVHSGRGAARRVLRQAIQQVLKKHPYVAGDDDWSAKAEAAIVAGLEATDRDRATALGKKLNQARGSYSP